MRSRRRRFETACRVGAFAVLGWLLGTTIVPLKRGRVERLTNADLADRLPDVTKSAVNLAIHVTMPVTPEPWQVAWLHALDHSGRALSWSGSPPAVAMSVEPISDPAGGVRVDVAAPAGSVVTLRDDASVIDSLRVSDLGGTVATPIAAGSIRGAVGGQRFAAPVNDSVNLRSVMVVGAAGWEGKYIVSALEERGWNVNARFSVAPNVEVTEGTIASLDTGRVAVLVAIDSTVQSLGGAVERFVRSGGGLIIAGPAARAKNLASLAPGTIAARTRPNVKPSDTVSLGSTGFYPVSLKGESVSLEKRPEGVAVAARRVGAGRVIQVGYDDSWRWRMAGGPGSERAHREWWARLVASAAYTPAIATSAAALDAGAAAPLASLTGRLGPARELSADLPSRPIDRRWLLALMTALLLAEWASRRLRGLR
jgi:hypothetical protein